MAITTQCCIVGGGPAGMMLGWLLARQGVRVTVLEKHKDFFRDFRGDTVHASTLNLIQQLGVLDEFLRIPHQRVEKASAQFGDQTITMGDLRRLPGPNKFVVLMPQWDFLNFIAKQASGLPGFKLLMEHKATALIRENGTVQGVTVDTPAGPIEIRADLVVACDGRHSDVRRSAAGELIQTGVDIDVLWFHVPRHVSDPEQVLGIVNYGRILILINRGDYFQAGLIIPKNSFAQLQAEGLEAFRQRIAQLAPYLREHLGAIDSWDCVKLLTVQINRLKRWYAPGLLLIGDAAHAMSPAGGVGINLAIQDAVATANMLGPHFDHSVSNLRAVQRRREFPARVVQRAQAFIHRVMVRSVFKNTGPMRVPPAIRILASFGAFRYLLARFIALGVRPERIAR